MSYVTEKKELSELSAYRNVFITTFTGKRFYFFNVTPDDIDIEDIIHSLCNSCRYNGHSNRFYSVAEHSLLTAKIAPREFELAALLHDAAEAYITDIPRPLKQLLNEYTDGLLRNMEEHIMTAIHQKFGVETYGDQVKQIKMADNSALFVESHALFDPEAIADWVYGERFDDTQMLDRFSLDEYGPSSCVLECRFRDALKLHIPELQYIKE